MTTNLVIESADDILENEHLLRTSSVSADNYSNLVALSLGIKSYQLWEAKREVLTLILDTVRMVFPKYSLWLFTGNSAWQDDTRIIRHKGFWSFLARVLAGQAKPQEFYEEIVTAKGKLKFFGAMPISQLSIDSILKVLKYERTTCLIAFPRELDDEVRLLLRQGWTADRVLDVPLLASIAQNNALLFRPFGEFDDREGGFYVIGELPSVQTLLTSLMQLASLPPRVIE
jgi:hypothetical protein